MNIYKLILEKIFEYKKLPYYGAERRIDVILSLFIEEILINHYKLPNIKLIAPEFPLKLNNNQAICIDYLLAQYEQSEPKKIFLVELKTDVTSINTDQFQNYQNWTWTKIIDGVKEKSIETDFQNREKYFTLISYIKNNMLINISENFNNYFKKLSDLFRKINSQTDVSLKDKMEITRTMINLNEEYTPINIPITTVYLGPRSINIEKFNGMDTIFFSNLINSNENENWNYLLDKLKQI